MFPDSNLRKINTFFTHQIVNLQHYPIYAYLSTKLEANQLDLATHLKKQLFVNDKAGAYDATDSTNPGFIERREVFGNETEQTDPDDTSKKIKTFTFDNGKILTHTQPNFF